jgi:exodeoxyribonuclease V beta subunit
MVVVAQHWRLEPSSSAPPMARLAAADAHRVVDGGWVLRSETPGVWDAAASALLHEQARLMYVAMTRAEHQLVVLLAAEEPDDEAAAPPSTPGRVLGLSAPVTSLEVLRAQLEPRLAPLGGCVRVVDGGTVLHEAPDTAMAPPPHSAGAALGVAPLPAPVRGTRREWSFTAISSYAGSEGHPDQGGLDEHHARASDGDDDGNDTDAPGQTPRGPLADLPASAEVGVCLHAVLERAEFTAPNPEAELRPLLARHAAVPSLAPHHDALAAGLSQLLVTPLGTSVPGNVALAQLARRDRLDELRFRLALAPRDRTVHVKQLGQLWADALSPSDPLHAYAGTLARGALDAWPAGFLVGAIDVVARLAAPSGDGTSRYLVIDYKSNRLPDGYHHQAMRRAMMAHHYPLQGLLYCVAVHRYLRWRTGIGDPSPQLAGFAYLFVRGMVGAHTPVDAHGRVHGVFHSEPPPGLVAAASALLAGDAAEVAA